MAEAQVEVSTLNIAAGNASSSDVNRRAIKATVIGVRKHLAQQEAEPGRSKALGEDPFHALTESGRLITPPFDMLTLAMLPEHNTELNQCIEAMEINIEGFGQRFVPRVDLSTAPKEIQKAVREEKTHLENFFMYASLRNSFTCTRRRMRKDLETTGNGYLEVIRNVKGKIQGLNHLPGYQMRLGKLEEKQVKVNVPILELQNDKSVKVSEIPTWERFRLFAQSRSLHLRRHHTITSGHGVRWFKEFGDPRVYDCDTGEEVKGDAAKTFPEDKRANEVIHFKMYSPRSPYGLPRFIGNLLSIFGDRASEEINYTTFTNNNIPSMMLLVSNGQLTQGTIDRIQDFVESQIQGSDNYSKFLIIEAEGMEEGEDSSQVKVDAKPLVETQHKDALFQNYSANNQDKVRRAFRLPPIFVGRCHSEDTEYLTESGWRTYDGISSEEKLATVNAASGGLEYQLPTARHVYDHDGTMLHLHNRGIDALVTPNHRMWTRPTSPKSRPEKPWRYTEAEELVLLRGGNGGHIELPVSACWEGKNKEVFTIPANRQSNAWNPDKPTKNPSRDLARYEKHAERDVSMEAFLRFLGYFVSEGSTTITRGPIVLSQKMGDVADSMVATLRELGFDPCVTAADSRPEELSISISHVGLWEWLRANCGEDSSVKRLPRWVLGLPSEKIKAVLDALIEGDGSRPAFGSPGSFTYSTTSRELNDQLHEICLRLGYALTSRLVDRSSFGWKDIWVSNGHYDLRHLLHPKKQIEHVEYQGKVSCFTVPNGLLVTRRNGRVLISGNSDDYTRSTAETSRRVADEQIFSPERDEFDSTINRRVFPDMGIIYHRFKSNSPNTTDNQELVKILGAGEKTGGMTPRIARMMLEDILGRELPDFAEGFDPDQPFSLLMAEAVKNKADPTEPGQQVTALKTLQLIEKLTEGDMTIDDEVELAKHAVVIQGHFEKRWRESLKAAEE